MRVLIADDDPVSRQLLVSKVQRLGYETIVACDGQEAMEYLNGPTPPRLVLIDWDMPGRRGDQILDAVRRQKTPTPTSPLLASNEKFYTYVIVITGGGMGADLQAALNAGADDYCNKPIQHLELALRLQTATRILTLYEELENTRDSLRNLATRDSLTGVWNRRAVMERLEEELARAARGNADLSVLMLDIDHFKQVNDTYGHTQGDIVLREIAHRVDETTRSYDGCGRYGGEEFIAVLPACKKENAYSVAERMRRCIAEKAILLDNGIAIHVTVSIGVASRKANGLYATSEDLLKSADAALYTAKNAGRNYTACAWKT